MRLEKVKLNQVNGWRIIKRYVIFFTAICLIPVFMVFMVATDNFVQPALSVDKKQDGNDQPTVFIRNNESVIDNTTIVINRLQRRKRHLKEACHTLGLDNVANDTLHKPNPWEYLVDMKHHLVWCNVFKAASTSWMYNFNILAGYTPQFLRRSRTPPFVLARKKYGRTTLDRLQNELNNDETTSFLIVRHPLERLLSAYRDKIQHAKSGSPHWKNGRKIIEEYRAKGTNGPEYPTYPEFIEWFLSSVKIGEPINMHWIPIVEFCTPCMFDIKIIAHTETLQEDQDYIIRQAGLQDIIKPEWRNARKDSTAADISKQYSQLTKSQILHLYDIYRLDFELFNYSLNEYLDAGRPDEDPSTPLAE